MSGHPRKPAKPGRRALAALAGAYGLTWGVAALGAVLGLAAGLTPAASTSLWGLAALGLFPLTGLALLALPDGPRVSLALLALGGAMTMAAQLVMEYRG